MIYLRCQCGSGLGVPGSFLGEAVPCPDCARSLRLVAAHELDGKQSARWRLEIARGPVGATVGEHILLGGSQPIEAGSADGQHLRMLGEHASETHCRFIPTEDGWIIEDATDDVAGVYVNGERVLSRALDSGDVIRIGEYELQYGPAGETVAPARRPTFVHVREPKSAPPPPPLAVSSSDEQVADDIPVAAVAPPGPACPSCRRRLAHGARICVDCGIDVRTGRSLLTAQGLDEDTLRAHATHAIRWLSWIAPLGLYPIASEARGNTKPYAIWSIAALTVVVSFIVFAMDWATPMSQLHAASHLSLWAGDRGAADARSRELLQKIETRSDGLDEASDEELVFLTELANRPALDFRPYQLLTHSFVHDGFFHLAGNLLFMLVLGTRVNALLGNVATLVLYPLLAVAGGVGHLVASRGEPLTPMIGASGAAMGLAGMYLVLFPAYRVHMVAWVWRVFTGFQLTFAMFPVRGFWVVLFFIMFDVLSTLLGNQDQVAHWAHLGGFIAGAAIALVLILTRVVNAHGGDILSVMLGKHAWPLVGKPRRIPPMATA